MICMEWGYKVEEFGSRISFLAKWELGLVLLKKTPISLQVLWIIFSTEQMCAHIHNGNENSTEQRESIRAQLLQMHIG